MTATDPLITGILDAIRPRLCVLGATVSAAAADAGTVSFDVLLRGGAAIVLSMRAPGAGSAYRVTRHCEYTYRVPSGARLGPAELRAVDGILDALGPFEDRLAPGRRGLEIDLGATKDSVAARLRDLPGQPRVSVSVPRRGLRARLLRLLDYASTRGVGEVVVSGPPDVFDAEFLRRIAAWSRLARVVVPWPAPDGTQFDAVALAALRDAVPPGLAVEIVLSITARTISRTDLIASFAGVLARRPPPPVTAVLEVAGPEEAEAAGEEPVSLSDLHERVPKDLRRTLTSTVTVRASAGSPLCLVPEALVRRVLHTERAEPRPPDAYASACGSCGLRSECAGVRPSYLARFGGGELQPFASLPAAVDDLGWEDRLRLVLTGRPSIVVRLSDVLPPDLMPAMPCTLPWTRIEESGDHSHGPCCCDFRAVGGPAPDGADPVAMWNSSAMRAFREAVAAGGRPATCRTSCPILASGEERPEELQLHGGTPAAVGNQVGLVRALLERRVEVEHAPLVYCFPATEHCNYRCVMCGVHRKKVPADSQRPASFYRDLEPWLERQVRLDAHGGEPLASSTFRAFVEDESRTDRPGVVEVSTNGSLLDPEWLESLPRLPFRTIVASLNAATPGLYRRVTRGLPWEVVRHNLDALLRMRDSGRYAGAIIYSMVLIRLNLHEIRAFADMAAADGVEVRFLLTHGDYLNQSIMTAMEPMTVAAGGLAEVAEVLDRRGELRQARQVRALVSILRARIAAGVFESIEGEAAALL
jgi:molybdenum cofactor biosynthesis enzyme MoaA